jgi:SAM-dependent methyltransferase
MSMRPDMVTGSGVSSPIMGATEEGFDPRYLAAKKSIDDRALNRYVWATLRQALPQVTGAVPPRILEIGAGIGTMLARIVDQGLLAGPATYLATDCDPGHLGSARHYLSTWAAEQGYRLSWSGKQQGRLSTANSQISVVLEAVSAEELADRTATQGSFDLVIAHAVLDLIDIPAVLPDLLAQLTPIGLAYLTCNFDGETVFLPQYQGEEEQEFLRRYHGSMETRLTGASHTGRRLLSYLQRPGLELLAAGSSDWVIHPRNAAYSDDEAFFLQAMIATVDRELAQQSPALPGLAAWTRTRLQQIEAGSLSFLASNLDLLAQRQPLLP